MAAATRCYDHLPMAWVGDWAGRRAALTPERVALFEPESGRRLTYRAVNGRAERAGHFLTATLGVKPGEPICLLSRNRLEAVDLYFACGKTGVVLAPLSYRLAEPELNDLVRRIAPRALFFDEFLAEQAAAIELPEGVERIELADGGGRYFDAVEVAESAERFVSPPADGGGSPDGSPQRSHDGLPERQPGGSAIQMPVSVNRPLPLAAPYLYVHTGGTSARPKICIVSHRQMVWNAIDLLATGGGALGPQRELLTFPLFHIGGWNTLTPVYYAGGFTVLTRSFDAGAVLELIEAEQISHLGAVEAMLQLISEYPTFATTDLSSVESITTAGAPCSASTMQPFWQRGVPVSQAYGLTEAGPSNFLYLGDDQSIEALRERCDSIGTSMFHTDYRIVDPQHGQPVAVGETGRLLMRSPHNFDGYLDEPERTEQTLLDDGWVDSGDLATVDAAGYVRIVGRVDSVFISGGENVSPEEIEQVLVRHAAVAKAVVVGVDDRRWGTVPAAALVVRAEIDAEQIQQYARRELAAFKVPRHIRFVEALPLTGAGKLDRNQVREWFAQPSASGEEG